MLQKVPITLHYSLLFACIAALLATATNVYGEVIPIDDGCAWDARVYCDRAIDMSPLFRGELDSYLINRILPSGLVSLGLHLTGATLDDRATIIGFKILHVAAIALSAFVWGLMAEELKLGSVGKVVGFVGLFVSFSLLKQPSFLPAFTDITAFTLSFLALYFYLKRNDFGLVIVIILGHFTWAMFVLFMAPLFIFKRQNLEKNAVPQSPSVSQKSKIIFSVALLVGVLLFSSSGYYLVLNSYKHFDGRLFLYKKIPLSFWINIAFIYFASYPLLFVYLKRRREIISQKYIVRGIVWLFLFFGLNALDAQLVNPALAPSSQNTPLLIYKAAVTQSLLMPFAYGIGHIMSFGPILIVAIFLWRKVADGMQKISLGLPFFVFAAILLSLNPPSRAIIILIAPILVFTAVEIDKLAWQRSEVIIFTILSFLYSKIWMKWQILQPPTNPNVDFLLFPWQHFFGYWGNWMGETMYFVNLGVIFLTAVVLFRMTFDRRLIG